MPKRRRRGFAVPNPMRTFTDPHPGGEAFIPLRESAPTATLTPLRETGFAEATRPTNPDASLIDVQIIEAGWGSSGYYPASVLERDGPKVFRAGTHMYVDHPTTTDEMERPERSVRDLAAVLTEDAYTADGGKTLRAKARVFAPYQPLIRDGYRDIGVSIRAAGSGHPGEADGRTGMIVDSIAYAESVDFVTRAGAGGKVLTLLESARTSKLTESGSIGVSVEAQLHMSFTCLADELYGAGRLTREERVTLSSAIGDALTTFVQRIEADAPQLYQRDRWGDPPTYPAGPEPMAVEESTTAPVPDGAPPAAPTHLEESMSQPHGGPPPAGSAGQAAGTVPDTAQARLTIVEAENARLRESANALTEAQISAANSRAEADRALAEARRLRADGVARDMVARMVADSPLDESLRPLITPRVTAAVVGRVPLTEAGEPNTEALTAAITAAIDAERSYAASLLEAQGVGAPRGLGATSGEQQLTDADFERQLGDVLGGLGLTEAETKLAVKGREF